MKISYVSFIRKHIKLIEEDFETFKFLCEEIIENDLFLQS